ncbi:MAG: hypothetical protein V1872_08830, partial [bacterium]
MINFKIFQRNFADIQDTVGKFMPNSVKDMLEKNISDTIKAIALEYPYIDSDYRDTYYNDFSKRFAYFDRNSVRLHLFSKGLNNIDDITPLNLKEYQDNYLGFITLRDTKVLTIGRSYISPKAKKNFSIGFYALTNYKVHLKGIEFKVEAFPWMQQDANVSRCAHVAIWSVVRYFSEKYHYYPHRTLYQVTNLLTSETRKSPSKGVTVEQVAQILANSAFYPEIYLRSSVDTKREKKFDRFLYTLVESGIPFIAGLTQKTHAFAVIGHGALKKASGTKGFNGVIDSFHLLDNLIVSDDNFFPYTRVSKETEAVTDEGSIYQYKDIDAMIIPYYEKMFLDIYYLYDLLLPTLERYYLKLNSTNQCFIRRVLLASSKSFKLFINNNSSDKVYKEITTSSAMPKFVWIIEYAVPENFDKKLIEYRIVIDASSLNFDENVFINIK